MSQEHQLVIIGGGPAGLTAGIYAARARLKTVLIEKQAAGGLINDAAVIENFPGFPQGINGYELGQLINSQAVRFGLETINAEVTGIEVLEEKRLVKTSTGDFTCRAIIIASGCERGKLGVPGEAEFTGKGVSYCATCDGPFFKEQAVAVVGGGDRAISDALHLARFASKIIVIHRRDQLRATRILQEKAFAEPKIQFLWDTVVENIEGDDLVGRLHLQNLKNGQKSELEVAGVFVCVGFKPNTEFLKGVVSLDEAGYIITNEKMETALPGIFAAGDVRRNSPQQAITAAGDGASAAIFAQKYITE